MQNTALHNILLTAIATSFEFMYGYCLNELYFVPQSRVKHYFTTSLKFSIEIFYLQSRVHISFLFMQCNEHR